VANAPRRTALRFGRPGKIVVRRSGRGLDKAEPKKKQA
jgi:hypothetical protein